MKLVIFDIDGTLCHSNYIDNKCFIKAFEDVTSKAMTNCNWNDYKNITDLGIINELYNNYYNEVSSDGIINKVKARYISFLKEELCKDETSFIEIPGAKDIINYLDKSNDYIVCFATGGFPESAKFKLNYLSFNIEHLLINGCGEFESKADIINDVIEKAKIKYNINVFDKIFYIGDREYDYISANSINIEFIGVDYRNKGVLRNLGVKKVVNNFEDINAFLNFLS